MHQTDHIKTEQVHPLLRHLEVESRLDDALHGRMQKPDVIIKKKMVCCSFLLPLP
jgi:hypothetical protein